MSKPPPKPDPDERFSLHPQEGEEVLRKLLGAEEEPEEGDSGGSEEAEAPS